MRFLSVSWRIGMTDDVSQKSEAKPFLEGFTILQGMKISKKQVIIIEILDFNNLCWRRSDTFKVLGDLEGNVSVASLREIKKNESQAPLYERGWGCVISWKVKVERAWWQMADDRWRKLEAGSNGYSDSYRKLMLNGEWNSFPIAIGTERSDDRSVSDNYRKKNLYCNEKNKLITSKSWKILGSQQNAF